MRSDIELVVSSAAEFEAKLRKLYDLSSTIRGLSNLAKAAESRGLGESFVYILCRIARIRNKFAHEPATKYNREDFIEMRGIIARELDRLLREKEKVQSPRPVVANSAHASANGTTPTATSPQNVPELEPSPEVKAADEIRNAKEEFFGRFSLDEFRKLKGMGLPKTRFGAPAQERLFQEWLEHQWAKHEKEQLKAADS